MMNAPGGCGAASRRRENLREVWTSVEPKLVLSHDEGEMEGMLVRSVAGEG